MTFQLKLHQKIKSFDNNIAISSKTKKITYKELNDISQKISTLLINQKSSHQIVGIIGQRKFSAYYGILGSIYSGYTYVPINEKYPLDRIDKMINESGITLLIGDKKSIYSIKDVIDFSNIKTIILPEEQSEEINNLSFKDTKIYFQEELSEVAPSEPSSLDQNKIAYILFTSGSTGNPKGVAVTYENLSTFINNFNKFYDLPIGYKASQFFDLSFDPSNVDVFFTWINGGQLCILSEFELIMPFEYIKREKINFWYSVPAIASFMYKMDFLTPNCFPDLKYSLFAGEALPKKLCDAWQIAAPKSTIENHYGPTEATVTITRFLYKKKYKNRIFKNNNLPIGEIYDSHTFALVDKNFNKVSKGDKGHLIIKGKQITNGYVNDIEKTKESFRNISWDKSNEIWYLTGDYACVNDFGEIEFLGRIDNQIKIAGRRIELEEVEAAILKASIINEIVVVPKKESDGSIKSLIAFTTSKISTDEIKFIKISALKFIEKLFLPSEIIFIEKMPLTTNGKIDRKKLFDLANRS